MGVGTQTVCLLGKPLAAGGCQPVVAAQPVIDDLLAVWLDQPVRAETVQRRVQGSGAQSNPPVRDLLDVGDDSVPMLAVPGQCGQDQERRLLHDTLAHADSIYRSTIYRQPLDQEDGGQPA